MAVNTSVPMSLCCRCYRDTCPHAVWLSTPDCHAVLQSAATVVLPPPTPHPSGKWIYRLIIYLNLGYSLTTYSQVFALAITHTTADTVSCFLKSVPGTSFLVTSRGSWMMASCDWSGTKVSSVTSFWLYDDVTWHSDHLNGQRSCSVNPALQCSLMDEIVVVFPAPQRMNPLYSNDHRTFQLAPPSGITALIAPLLVRQDTFYIVFFSVQLFEMVAVMTTAASRQR